MILQSPVASCVKVVSNSLSYIPGKEEETLVLLLSSYLEWTLTANNNIFFYSDRNRYVHKLQKDW